MSTVKQWPTDGYVSGSKVIPPVAAGGGGGGGSGTVTSVGLSLPAQFNVSGTPVTASGTLTAAWANESANTVFAGPASGSAAAPTFRVLTGPDLPISGASPTVQPSEVMVNKRWARMNATANLVAYGFTFNANGNNQGAPINPTSTASIYGQMRQQLTGPGTTTAGSNSGFSSSQLEYNRGSAAGCGGFLIEFRWSFVTGITPNSRFYAGLYTTAGGFPVTTVEPSTYLNCLAFANDSTDTNLQVMTNDGTGTATKINLGSSFPIAAQQVYRGTFYCAPNSSTIDYWITNEVNGAVASGTLSTDLPSNTIFYNFVIQRAVGTTSGQNQWCWLQFYSETPGY